MEHMDFDSERRRVECVHIGTSRSAGAAAFAFVRAAGQTSSTWRWPE